MENKIEIYDNTVPYHVMEWMYSYCIHSGYRLIGWHDTLDTSKKDIHSNWTYDDLKRSKILPYLEKVYPEFEKRWKMSIVNLVKPGDHYLTHTHTDDTDVLLYYANIDWKDEWAGETIFYNDNRVTTNAYQYVPGRILKFPGHLPHSIRPQSPIGPQFRFTLTCFLNNKDV